MSSSIQAVLRATQARLEAISDAPAREAEWLLEHVTGFNLSEQLRNPGNELLENQLEKINYLILRRAAGEPLAYLLGEQHFWTLRLKVSPAVLIPRPETELLVERALHHLDPSASARVLDLGTGSGAIALAVARERPTAQLWAVDQSLAALAIAQENATTNDISNVSFVHGDWFSALPPEPYALILSNPPYIAEDDPEVQPAVRAHEPHQALFAGSDGLDAIRHIITRAPGFLAPDGWLVLEHGWQQAAAVRQLLELAGLSSVASHADLAGHWRVTEAQLAAR
jgi:release factor glutamine methyltransferase